MWIFSTVQGLKVLVHYTDVSWSDMLPLGKIYKTKNTALHYEKRREKINPLFQSGKGKKIWGCFGFFPELSNNKE